MRKNKLLLLLALLMTAATGAWAQDTYKIDAVYTFTASGQSQSQDLSIDDASLPFTKKLSELDPYSSFWKENNYDANYITVSGDNIEKGTDANWDTEITINGAGTATVSYAIQLTGYADVGTATITFTVTKNEATPAAATYTVSLKGGVKDADKWTISPNPAEEGQTVTLQYNGRLKVKGVKATSEAAPAEASVPEGAISGVFSVSDTKQVYFSKGNLRYESGAWSFFDNQYDYYTSYSKNAWDKFGWSTSATTYGMNTSNANNDYSGDFVDWGATMGAGWFTLTSDEWKYLFNTRTVNGGTGSGKSYTMGQSVNGNLGVVFYPDNYTGEVYSGSDWATFESAGCVFLPAAGLRQEKWVSSAGSNGYYWSATPDGKGWAYYVYFDSGFLNPASNDGRFNGCSVRLVREVATSDAPAKPAAAVTTAPTGAAVVGVGKSTALVSGGAADGGTLMYAVTTTNTKPTSTAGFSDAVPTAKDITASGKVYVWYYVKADDTHSDSEIAATAIEVPVADIVWDVTNVSDIYVMGTSESYEKEGVTLSGNGEVMYASWFASGDPTTDGIDFFVQESGGFTFTAPTGKAFTRIEMRALSSGGWDEANLGTGWALVLDMSNNLTVTWKGTAAASTVDLLTDADELYGSYVKYIAFTLVDAE